MTARRLKGLLFGALALSGCAGPVAVTDPHADAGSRLYDIASRFEQDGRQGGMSGIIADIQQCYASATMLVVKAYALPDCIVLDYVGYRADVVIGRQRLHGRAPPFFENQVFATRADHYAHLDSFTSPDQLSQYLRDTNDSCNWTWPSSTPRRHLAPRKPVQLGQHHEGLE